VLLASGTTAPDWIISSPAADELKPGDIPTSHQAGYIGLVIGAAHATKRLPFHKLEEICRQAQHPLILLGGPEDSDTAKRLATIDPDKDLQRLRAIQYQRIGRSCPAG